MNNVTQFMSPYGTVDYTKDTYMPPPPTVEQAQEALDTAKAREKAARKAAKKHAKVEAQKQADKALGMKTLRDLAENGDYGTRFAAAQALLDRNKS